MKQRLEDYPLSVQDLLRWAGYHLEQVDTIEREFQAWERARDTERVQVVTLNIAANALEANRRRRALPPLSAQAGTPRWVRARLRQK